MRKSSDQTCTSDRTLISIYCVSFQKTAVRSCACVRKSNDQACTSDRTLISIYCVYFQKTIVRSCACVRKSNDQACTSDRDGKPLIVICIHPQEINYVSRGYILKKYMQISSNSVLLFVCFEAYSLSTLLMSVNLSTLFISRLPKHLTSTKCPFQVCQ